MVTKTSNILKSMKQQNQKVQPIGTEIILPNHSGLGGNQDAENFLNNNFLRNDGDIASGNYTFDTDTLFIDTVNHRVGIGSISPIKKLYVYQNLNTDHDIMVKNGYAGKGSYITTQANSFFASINCVCSTGNAWKMGFFSDAKFRVVSDWTTIKYPFQITNLAPTNSFYINDLGNVGFGTANPETSAKVEISTTTGALLLSRMTTTERDALTAVNGMIIYNSTDNKFQGYENGAWINLI